ncbi:MAG: hypothetical protein ABSE17_03565 [Candidatus Levyibacteriota bacterium]|jgi:hypothetical protein
MPPEGDSSRRQEAHRRAETRKPYIARYGPEIGRPFTDYSLARREGFTVEKGIELREKLIDAIADYMQTGNRLGRLWATRALADLASEDTASGEISSMTREGGK